MNSVPIIVFRITVNSALSSLFLQISFLELFIRIAALYRDYSVIVVSDVIR